LGEVADAWQRGAVHELEHAKRSAFDNGDGRALIHFAGELERVRGLAGDTRSDALGESLRDRPQEARRRIRAGRDDARNAERTTAAVVRMLGPKQERDLCYAA
jgi:hypothetical protein